MKLKLYVGTWLLHHKFVSFVRVLSEIIRNFAQSFSIQGKVLKIRRPLSGIIITFFKCSQKLHLFLSGLLWSFTRTVMLLRKNGFPCYLSYTDQFSLAYHCKGSTEVVNTLSSCWTLQCIILQKMEGPGIGISLHSHSPCNRKHKLRFNIMSRLNVPSKYHIKR